MNAKSCRLSTLAVVTCLLLTFWAGSSTASPTTYFLSPNGSDTNPGTLDEPWSTLEKASQEARAGDTILLLPGVYEGVLRPLHSGTADAPITFRAAKRRTARLVGQSERIDTVQLVGVSHIHLDGVHISPAPLESGLSILVSQASHSSQENPLRRSLGRWIYVEDASHIHITDVLMEETPAADPFYITQSRDIFVRDSVMRSNVQDMVVVDNTERIVFEGNAISRSGHVPFRMQNSVRSLVIRGNVFHPGWSRAMELRINEPVLFEHNIVTNSYNGGRSNTANSKLGVIHGIFRFNRAFRNWSGPLHTDAGDGEHHLVYGLRFYNNVFDDNLGYGFRVSRAQGRNMVFVNNIFSRNDGHGYDTQLNLIRLEDPERAFFTKNTFYGSGPDQPAHVNTATLTSLESPFWQRLRGAVFVDNLETDPQYAAPEQYNHALRPESPLLDAGRFLTHAVGAGEGRDLPVQDALYFYDGFGIEGEIGDTIAVGTPGQLAQVIAVDRVAQILTLDRVVRWENGDAVSLPWSGGAPDIGVYEHGAISPPIVQVDADPFLALPGEPVRLQAILHGIADPVEVRWQLGDGSLAYGSEVVHTYSQADDYPVRVRVTDQNGRTFRGTGYVVVEEPLDPSEPLLRNTFDADDDTWWRTWQSYRPTPADYRRRLDDDGKGVLHIYSVSAVGRLPNWAYPVGWEIDRYPMVHIKYRIDPGTSLVLYLQAFESEWDRRVVAAGTSSARVPGFDPSDYHSLIDDGKWYTLSLDARIIRERFPEVELLQGIGFEATHAVPEGNGYWLDLIEIGP